MAEYKKLGAGGRFKSLTEKVEKEGYSKKSAQAVAAVAGRKAHGKKKMAKWAAAGKKRAAKRK